MVAGTSSRSQRALGCTYYSNGDTAGETSLVSPIVPTSITFSPRNWSFGPWVEKASYLNPRDTAEVAHALRWLYNSSLRALALCRSSRCRPFDTLPRTHSNRYCRVPNHPPSGRFKTDM